MRKVWLFVLMAVIFCLALAGCSKINALETTTLRSFDCEKWHNMNIYSLTNHNKSYPKRLQEYTFFPSIVDGKNISSVQFSATVGYLDELREDSDRYEFKLIFDIDGKKAIYDHVRAFEEMSDDQEFFFTRVETQKDVSKAAQKGSEGLTPVKYDAENTAADLDGQMISLLADIYNSEKTVMTFITRKGSDMPFMTIDRTVSGDDRDAIRLALTLYACKANEPGLLKEIGVNP